VLKTAPDANRAFDRSTFSFVRFKSAIRCLSFGLEPPLLPIVLYFGQQPISGDTMRDAYETLQQTVYAKTVLAKSK